MGFIEKHRDLVEELCLYSRLCYDRRLVGAAGGNLSARVPGGETFIVTASGISLRDVTPGNVVVVGSDGQIQENPMGLSPSKECGLHLAIYHSRADANAVVHVHPTHTTAYAVAGRQIPLCTVSARLKLKQTGPIPEADPGSDSLIRSVGSTLRDVFRDASVLLLGGHGLAAYGATLQEAFNQVELAEETARVAYLSSRLRSCPERFSWGVNMVDLTAPLNERMPHLSSDPPFRMEWHKRLADAGANISRLSMGGHAGTHVDVPRHFLETGSDLAQMSMESFMGRALALNVPKPPGEDVTPDDFGRCDVLAGHILLLRTGWERYACSDDFFEHDWPGVSPQAIDYLLAMGITAVGGDFPSIDSRRNLNLGSPSHKKALSAGCPVFEGLVNLNKVIGKRFFFIGLPLKVEGGEASPIRAAALID